MNKNLEELIKDLEYAKKATQSCLDNQNTLVDMHSLSYWASVVEKLRMEIKQNEEVSIELLEEYKKTINSLLIRLAKKEKEIKKYKEALSKDEGFKEWKRSNM